MTIAEPLIASGFVCVAAVAVMMDQNTKDVLLALLPIISALGFGYLAYKGNVEAKARTKIAEDVLAGNTKLEVVAREVALVKTATNGLSDKFAEASKKEGHAEGKDQERLEQKAREAERAIGSLAVKDSAGVPGPLAEKEKNGAEAKLPPDKPAT